jgi:hypothetical protein
LAEHLEAGFAGSSAKAVRREADRHLFELSRPLVSFRFVTRRSTGGERNTNFNANPDRTEILQDESAGKYGF